MESNLTLNFLLPEIHESTVGIFLSERVGTGSKVPRMLGQLALIEQDLFNALAPGLSGSSDQVGSGHRFGFAELQQRFGVPVRVLPSLREPQGLQMLQDAGADLFVSIRFGQILSNDALVIPSRGVLNLHSGLLPHYRGVLATFRALLNGDPEIGCTLHWIDSPGIDVGRIIETARVTVEKERSLLWHILALYQPGAGLILDAIRRLERGEPMTGAPQDPSAGAYYSFPSEEDLMRFTTLGWRLFDREDVWDLFESYGFPLHPRTL
ncbi:formyl transferase [Pseudomonas chlororaphis]|uniref:formyl transferase n=1 Tax=Pseudomonas chlororaphis TaxID=587753 RepID=UPI001F4C31D4|nr:formyl transferase [Pseudomonas chlororaphis]